MITHNCDQKSEAWFNVRLGRVTGTRFGILVSKESTKGYQDLILDIAGEIITQEGEPEGYVSPAMERGTELEPFAREEFEAITGIKVHEAGFISPNEDNEFAEWVGVSPDGIIVGQDYESGSYPDAGLEIKCPMKKTHLTYLNKGVLPNEYKWQVQGSLFVSGLSHWWFMSYHPNMKPFIIKVEPDEEMQQIIGMRLGNLIQEVDKQLQNYSKLDYSGSEI